MGTNLRDTIPPHLFQNRDPQPVIQWLLASLPDPIGRKKYLKQWSDIMNVTLTRAHYLALN